MFFVEHMNSALQSDTDWSWVRMFEKEVPKL